jgi:hypothetical protein
MHMHDVLLIMSLMLVLLMLLSVPSYLFSTAGLCCVSLRSASAAAAETAAELSSSSVAIADSAPCSASFFCASYCSSAGSMTATTADRACGETGSVLPCATGGWQAGHSGMCAHRYVWSPAPFVSLRHRHDPRQRRPAVVLQPRRLTPRLDCASPWRPATSPIGTASSPPAKPSQAAHLHPCHQ